MKRKVLWSLGSIGVALMAILVVNCTKRVSPTETGCNNCGNKGESSGYHFSQHAWTLAVTNEDFGLIKEYLEEKAYNPIEDAAVAIDTFVVDTTTGDTLPASGVILPMDSILADHIRDVVPQYLSFVVYTQIAESASSNGYSFRRYTYYPSIFGREKIVIKGKNVTEGTIMSGGDVIVAGEATVTGNVYAGVDRNVYVSERGAVDGIIGNLPLSTFTDTLALEGSPGSSPLIITGSRETVLSTGEYHYSIVRVGGNGKLKINGKVEIHCESFMIAGNGKIEIENGGVTFYISRWLKISGNAKAGIGEENPKVGIFLSKTAADTAKITGNSEVDMVIWAPYTPINISGNARYEGSIMAQSILIEGHSNVNGDEVFPISSEVTPSMHYYVVDGIVMSEVVPPQGKYIDRLLCMVITLGTFVAACYASCRGCCSDTYEYLLCVADCLDNLENNIKVLGALLLCNIVKRK